MTKMNSKVVISTPIKGKGAIRNKCSYPITVAIQKKFGISVLEWCRQNGVDVNALANFVRTGKGHWGLVRHAKHALIQHGIIFPDGTLISDTLVSPEKEQTACHGLQQTKKAKKVPQPAAKHGQEFDVVVTKVTTTQRMVRVRALSIEQALKTAGKDCSTYTFTDVASLSSYTIDGVMLVKK